MSANTSLVMIQTLLAFVFLFAGGMKLFLGPEALAMPIALAPPVVRALGVAEVFGAVGLILPWYLGIRPLLTPLAAAGLMLVATGATIFTMFGEDLASGLFPLVLALLCAAVVYGRWPRGAAGSSGKTTSAHLRLSVAAMIIVFSPHAGSPTMHASSASGTLIVKVQGFRTTSGSARISLFNRASGFPDDETAALRRSVATIGDGQVEARFDDLRFGEYAVAIHHDENNDAKMNRRLFGVPKEGYGVSNNIRHSRRAPTFDEARFSLDSASRIVNIDVHY